VPLRRALEQLFRGTGRQYAVEPTVPDIPISLRARDLDFTSALRVLTRLGGATYRKEGNIFIIGARLPEPGAPRVPAEAVSAPARAGRRLTLDLRGVPFRRALEPLFEGSGRQYAVTPDVRDILVTLNLRDADFQTAFETLLRLAGATYRQEGNMYVIRSRRPGDPAGIREEAPFPVPPAALEQGGVAIDLHVEQLPFRLALAMLFQQARAQYAVAPDVPDSPLSVHLRDIDFATALRAMTRLAGATYTKEGGVYLIRARPAP
jgi:hypothetical protein